MELESEVVGGGRVQHDDGEDDVEHAEGKTDAVHSVIADHIVAHLVGGDRCAEVRYFVEQLARVGTENEEAGHRGEEEKQGKHEPWVAHGTLGAGYAQRRRCTARESLKDLRYP